MAFHGRNLITHSIKAVSYLLSNLAGIPYIGEMPDIANLWANFGHFRNGLCMGAGSAQLLRQLILKQVPIVDPSPYSPSRLKKKNLVPQ